MPSAITRYYYSSPIRDFIHQDAPAIVGELVRQSAHDITINQRNAWQEEIDLLKDILKKYAGRGSVYFEYNIPRLGRRIDAIVLIDGVVFILEFKTDQGSFERADIAQVWDYALDLKNFHEGSHRRTLIPILVATDAPQGYMLDFVRYEDQVFKPLLSDKSHLKVCIDEGLKHALPFLAEDDYSWAISRYSPTPTIIEAASALYNNHSVKEISRSDASAENLTTTCDCISDIIDRCKAQRQKAICFVTGVPGAGKILVGLNIAIQQFEKNEKAVYLSGNFPLVAVLTVALSRDLVKKKKEQNERITKREAQSEVKTFIQMVHHYRDACLEGTKVVDHHIVADEDYFRSAKNKDKSYAPIDHVAIFDEAQRAWTKEMLAKFMAQKKPYPYAFPYSEPEYLISCLDRHPDWAVIICLIGGGQEINTGEAGIKEWIDSLNHSFAHWKIYISNRLTENEYANGQALNLIQNQANLCIEPHLHLAVSMRSFRAENLSTFVHELLNLNPVEATKQLERLRRNYPIYLTRNIDTAKRWLKSKARGSERFGLLASSTADRVKPLSINVRYKPDEVHWFLDDDSDVRSSNYLEDVATEFQVQGLELDWTCVVWDADMRYSPQGWQHYRFNGGTRWYNIRQEIAQTYQTNAYRVLLTRARQGMIIVVPTGNPDDPTRLPAFYDATYQYLSSIGIQEI